MSWNWSGYAGREIDTWKLDSFLGTRNGRGFFTSQSGPDAEPVLVQVMRGDDPEAEAALASWERAKGLALENLLKVHACGEAELDGTPIAYGVMDLPEDELAEILARGQVANAQAFIAAIERALADLHRDGLCHGAVTPSNVFVVRGTPRLSVDTIHPCPETERQHDLDQARSIAQAIGPIKPKTAGRADRARPFLEAAIVLGVVLLLASYFLFGRREGAKEVAKRTEPTAQAPANPEPPPPAPSHAPQATEPSHAGTADRVSAAPTRRGGWAVIAATYDSFGAAEKRAESLQRRSAELKAHVFPARGQGKHYFVVLGSGLTQREAEQLRRQARSHGAPPDTYVTKLDES